MSKGLAIIVAAVLLVSGCVSDTAPEAGGPCDVSGSTRCEEPNVLRCTGGTWTLVEACGPETTCAERLWVNDDGEEIGAAWCVDGTITDLPCALPDAFTCVDREVMRCLEGRDGEPGLLWVVTTCEAEEVDTPDDGLLSAGFCVGDDGIGARCDQPGATECVGQEIRFCGPHWEPMWFAWQPLANCAAGTVCVQGTTESWAGDTIPSAHCQETP
jgi:hypothetical protein